MRFDYRINLFLDKYGAGQDALEPQGGKLDFSDGFSYVCMVEPGGNIYAALDWENHYFLNTGEYVAHGFGFCAVRESGESVTDVKMALKKLLNKLQWLNPKDYQYAKKYILDSFWRYLRFHYYGVEYDVTIPWKYANPLTTQRTPL